MDSKLRRMAIMASMAVILLVSILVVYTNSDEEQVSKGEYVQSGVVAETEESRQEEKDLSAFLKDPTFFDEEVNPVLEAAKDAANRLSLITTSVERDLRIQIVNNKGVPVKGKSIYVELDGLGEYKDLDKDGVIYIGGLDAGEYYVELLPVEGYKVPVTETKIRVKDKVEYLAIEVISLLIKTEDEIDVEKEELSLKISSIFIDQSLKTYFTGISFQTSNEEWGLKEWMMGQAFQLIPLEEYIKDKKHMTMRQCAMTEDGPDNEWKILATWMFNPEEDTQKEADSIANDFVENCSSAVAIKKVKNAKKNKNIKSNCFFIFSCLQ